MKAILTAITALILFTGCSTQKKLDRAKQMVLLDPTARHDVFLKELQFFPCANDSSTTFVEGGVDSVSLRAYFDWLNGIRPEGEIYDGRVVIPGDSVFIVNPVDTATVSWPCADTLTVYYKRGYADGVKYLLNKKIPIPRPDTIKTSIRDKQQIGVLKESIAKEKEENARLKGIVDTQEKEIGKKDKKITGWIWLFIAAVVLLILILILALIGKIKRIFP